MALPLASGGVVSLSLREGEWWLGCAQRNGLPSAGPWGASSAADARVGSGCEALSLAWVGCGRGHAWSWGGRASNLAL